MKNIEEKDMDIIIKMLESLGYSVEYDSGHLFDNNMFTLNIVGRIEESAKLNSCSKGKNILSNDDIRNIFLDSVADVCAENGINVSERHTSSISMRHFDFHLGGEKHLHFNIHKSATCISPWESEKLCADIINSLKKKEEKEND